MAGQQVILCPQCGGNKVKSNAKGTAQVLIGLGILVSLTIIGIPLGIGLFIASLLVKKSKLRLKFRCAQCAHEFNVTEDKYESYQKQIG